MTFLLQNFLSFVFGAVKKERSLPEKIGVNNGHAKAERKEAELTHFTAQLLCKYERHVCATDGWQKKERELRH